MPGHSKNRRHDVARVAVLVMFVATLATQVVVATTFMSVEPIPGGAVVGEPTLAVIESAGYENLELWSNRLLNDCGFVRSTIDALTLKAPSAPSTAATRMSASPPGGSRGRRIPPSCSPFGIPGSIR
jgi:ribosomal protein S5